MKLPIDIRVLSGSLKVQSSFHIDVYFCLQILTPGNGFSLFKILIEVHISIIRGKLSSEKHLSEPIILLSILGTGISKIVLCLCLWINPN